MHEQSKDYARIAQVAFVGALLLGYYDFAIEIAREVPVLPNGIHRGALEALVRDFARCRPENAAAAVRRMARAIEANPSDANVLVGGFVDSRRLLSDYDDVLNVSPLPRAL